MFYSLDKLKPKTKTKNQIFFVVDISALLYIFKKEDKKTFFPFLKNVSLSPLFKVYKKVVEFSFILTKNILFFRFWFQFIQQIEQYIGLYALSRPRSNLDSI